jgi:hypothetical protein
VEAEVQPLALLEQPQQQELSAHLEAAVALGQPLPQPLLKLAVMADYVLLVLLQSPDIRLLERVELVERLAELKQLLERQSGQLL